MADEYLSVEDKQTVFDTVKIKVGNKDWADAAEIVCTVILASLS